MALLWLFLIAACFTISVNTLSPWSCDDIDEDVECQDILMDKYSLTVQDFHNMMPLHQTIMLDGLECVREDKCPLQLDRVSGSEIECTDGFAAVSDELQYPCKDVNLLSFIPLRDLGSQLNASGSDIWGWTKYDDSNVAIGYYALTCQTDGVSIVDITDPVHPNVLAFIESNVSPIRHV